MGSGQHVAEHLLLRPGPTVAFVPPLTADALHARVLHLTQRLRLACGGELKGCLVALAAPATNAYAPVPSPSSCWLGVTGARVCVRGAVPCFRTLNPDVEAQAAAERGHPACRELRELPPLKHSSTHTGACWRRCSRSRRWVRCWHPSTHAGAPRRPPALCSAAAAPRCFYCIQTPRSTAAHSSHRGPWGASFYCTASRTLGWTATHGARTPTGCARATWCPRLTVPPWCVSRQVRRKKAPPVWTRLSHHRPKLRMSR
jgi:hypothetical protein